MDYSLYYREEIPTNSPLTGYDLFLSAYNHSDRLKIVYDSIKTENKFWLIFPEYDFLEDELPSESDFIIIDGKGEAEQIKKIIENLKLHEYKNKNICVDTTGFMRPQLLFVLFYFKTIGFQNVDFLYSEPDSYSKKENTQFSSGAVIQTKAIAGYSGSNTSTKDKDLLIIASGYDSTLIEKVAQYHENADIVHLLGFPSLKADMYQENILKILKASDALPDKTLSNPIFAPASDPFETASEIEKYISNKELTKNYRHIYLSPLSTKAQTLGMGLAYLNHFTGKNISIVFPYTAKYSKETSVGISRLWKYSFEFD